MADEIIELPVAEVEEVDVIENADSYETDDVIIDDNGQVVEAFNREKNKTFVVKGKGISKPTEKKVDDADKDKGDNPDTKPYPTKPDPNPKDKDQNKDEKPEEFVNSAEFVLRQTGYKKDEVDVGDGVIVKIKDLTEEQQLNLMVVEFTNNKKALEGKITELEGRKPELTFDDPTANQILSYLKDGGDLKLLAKEILSKDPAAQAKMLSDSDVVKLDIKKTYPTFTDEDIDAEFKEMSDAQVARRAKAGRARMESEKPDFTQLTEAQKAANIIKRDAEKKEFDDQSAGVKKVITGMKDVLGYQLTDQVKGFISKQILPENMEDDSEFVKSISNNPEKLVRLQFLDSYAQRIIEATRKKYYDLGIEEGSKGKEKLSDEPVRSYSTSGKTDKKIAKKNLEEFTDEEWAKFGDAPSF